MSGDRQAISNDTELDTVKIRTKPCWICGQHSYLIVPTEAWKNHDLYDVPLDTAWPGGSAADKLLYHTGVHPTCWDDEFPDDVPKEK